MPGRKGTVPFSRRTRRLRRRRPVHAKLGQSPRAAPGRRPASAGECEVPQDTGPGGLGLRKPIFRQPAAGSSRARSPDGRPDRAAGSRPGPNLAGSAADASNAGCHRGRPCREQLLGVLLAAPRSKSSRLWQGNRATSRSNFMGEAAENSLLWVVSATVSLPPFPGNLHHNRPRLSMAMVDNSYPMTITLLRVEG